MIETQDMTEFPVFSDNGTNIAPEAAKYSEGFNPSETLPAAWLNYFLNRASSAVTKLNAGVESMEKELNKLLEEAEIDPDSGLYNQVSEAIKQYIKNATGDLATLETTSKATLVAAINENKAAIDTNAGAIAQNAGAIAQNTAAINSINMFMLPVGTILPFGGDHAPEGFGLCDGHEESRSLKSALFGVIGINYGDGDGTTTFNVPDFRDRTLQGASETNTVGKKLAAGLPNINGIALFNIGANQTVGTGALKKSKVVNTASGFIGSTAGAMTVPQIEIDASDSSTIYKNNFNTVQPPAQCCNFIIKY